jgi:hypothetical protein
MKLFIGATLNMFYIFIMLIGCATSEEAKRIDQHGFYDEGIAFAKAGEYDRAIAFFAKR